MTLGVCTNDVERLSAKELSEPVGSDDKQVSVDQSRVNIENDNVSINVVLLDKYLESLEQIVSYLVMLVKPVDIMIKQF